LARAQLDAIVAFRCTLPADLRMLTEYGFDSEKVKNLEIPSSPPWIGGHIIQSISARDIAHVLNR
jgi:hypothetical protein